MGRVFVFFTFLLFCLTACSRHVDGEESFVEALKFYSVKDFHNAESKCDGALRHNRDYRQAYFLKAKILFNTGRKEESIKMLYKLSRRSPSYEDPRLYLIKALIETDRLEEAKKILIKALEENGNDFRVYSLYSSYAKKRNDLKQSLGFQKKAEECLEEGTSVFLDLAGHYGNFGLEESSREYLLRAQALAQKPELKKVISDLLEDKH